MKQSSSPLYLTRGEASKPAELVLPADLRSPWMMIITSATSISIHAKSIADTGVIDQQPLPTHRVLRFDVA